jgi:hypothetical protein
MVSRKHSVSSFRIRVSISPIEYPALCAALQQIPAGRRRARRLATLAHVGALFEHMQQSGEATSQGPQQPGNTPSSQHNGPRLHLSAEELADLTSWGN